MAVQMGVSLGIGDLEHALADGDADRVEAIAKLILASPRVADASPDADRLRLLVSLAEWLRDKGRPASAIALYEDAVEELRREQEPKPADIAAAFDGLAELLAETGQPDRAADVLKQALGLSRRQEGDASRAVQWRLDQQSVALNAAGRSTEGLVVKEDLKQIHILYGERELSSRRHTEGANFLPGASDGGFIPVEVFFATHREATGSSNPYRAYSGKLAELSFGKARMTVPLDRQPGELPTPPYWFRLQRQDASRHIVIEKVDGQKRDPFYRELSETVDGSERREILLFIHGFNNTMSDALMRTAQLAVDLEIDGAPVLYSWPSAGSKFFYGTDRNMATKDGIVREAADFVESLLPHDATRSLYLAAHSMGCELVSLVLKELTVRQPVRPHKPLKELVFAAPDVDGDSFRERVPAMISLASRVTVYCSEEDKPLEFMGWKVSDWRAGWSAAKLAGCGVEGIDTTSITGDWLGHADFASSAIDDLRAVIWLGLDPGRRRILLARETEHGAFWQHLDPVSLTPSVASFRDALKWLRRVGLERAMRTIPDLIAVYRNDAARREFVAQLSDTLTEFDRFHLPR